MEVAASNSDPRLQQSADREISTTNAVAAWHLFGILLSHRGTMQANKLASKCRLFYCTPDCIQFLCSIPNSPIRLTANQLVTLSRIGFHVIALLLPNSDATSTHLDLRSFAAMLLKDTWSSGMVKTYYRKRKRVNLEVKDFPKPTGRCLQDLREEDLKQMMFVLPQCLQDAYAQVIKDYSSYENMGENIKTFSNISSVLTSDSPEVDTLSISSLLMDSKSGRISQEFEYIERAYNVMDDSFLSQLEIDWQKAVSQSEKDHDIEVCRVLTENVNEEIKKPSFGDSYRCRDHKENFPVNIYVSGRENVAKLNNVTLCLDKVRTVMHLQCKEGKVRQPGKSAFMHIPENKNASNIRRKTACHRENQQHVSSHTVAEYSKRTKTSITVKQKLKRTIDKNMNTKEKLYTCIDNKKKSSFNAINHDSEQKPFPEFTSFTIEEQEGSGGYGTVYKARRKADGVAFAIKCPHDNANRTHVQNELKMLEKFGGKNFVIRYEGSLKNGNSDCLVLEHVEHDRPEVLKKEIDVYQLRSYGYCMFRALAGLHKQGIVHRDVKPGNFLFSSKVNEGYLIDFNLALDVHKKCGNSANSKAQHDVNFDQIPLQEKFISPVKSRKLSVMRFPEVINQKVINQNAGWNNSKSQGADGSGVTSARDPASTRTPSVERLREPMPNQGRKELISFVQDALQGGNIESANAPTSKRKRIAAFPATIDHNFFYPTPMPLHASGVGIAGAGLLKDEGERKNKREGPCVGTKGFRAPEVLFRSLHQGPKVDIWSAGVTLLYLIIGRAPFGGDPDQNIKEIVKLRGSEDLWEVAKLHNHESSFPAELLDVRYLPSVKLKDWCIQNTRRPDFLNGIPMSLLDLVDKCLTVNPRLRISADEALRHEFFAPCREAFRKHRLKRQDLEP